VETESDGTRRSTGGEVKGKEANGVGSQYSCTVSEHGLSSITTACTATPFQRGLIGTGGCGYSF